MAASLVRSLDFVLRHVLDTLPSTPPGQPGGGALLAPPPSPLTLRQLFSALDGEQRIRFADYLLGDVPHGDAAGRAPGRRTTVNVPMQDQISAGTVDGGAQHGIARECVALQPLPGDGVSDWRIVEQD